ncbi:MAG: hypothetical protein AAGA43_12010 [Bacteroidota bacterium]
MLKNLFALTLISLFFLSCSSDSSSSDDVIPPNSGNSPISEEDTTAPVVSISDILDVVEVLTPIQFSITDSSNNVTTQIFIDDTEVFSSQEKQFIFELDPYDFPSGAKTMRVVSEDSSENETTENVSFELKRLLFRLPDAQGRISNSFQDYFMALNSQDGELLASAKLVSDDELSFYAEDDFERQDIVATLYILFPDPNTSPRGFVLSFDDVPAGTIALSDAEIDEIYNLNTRSGSFQLDMMDAASDTDFYMNGKDVSLISLSSFAEGNFSESGSYDPNSSVPAFIYSNPENVNDLGAYQYLFIDNLEENTSVSFDDFLPLQETNQIDIPNEVSDFTFELRAYEDEAGFDLGEYSTVLRFRGNRDDENGILNIPQLSEFDVYQQNFNATISPTLSWNGFFKGFGTPTLPSWNAALQGTEVVASGDFDVAQFIVVFTSPTTFDDLTWIYHAENKPLYRNPFDNFVLPDAVATFLNNDQIDTSGFDQITFFRADLFEYEEEFNMSETVFTGFPFLNSKGDQQIVGFTLINDPIFP